MVALDCRECIHFNVCELARAGTEEPCEYAKGQADDRDSAAEILQLRAVLGQVLSELNNCKAFAEAVKTRHGVIGKFNVENRVDGLLREINKALTGATKGAA